MGKNKKLIAKIRKVWKQQEDLEKENHKKISLMLKTFSYKNLKEILEEEEQELWAMGCGFDKENEGVKT